MTSVLKVPLLALGAWFINAVIKPPLPPAQDKKGDKVSNGGQKGFEKNMRFFTLLVRYGNNGLFLLEAAVLALQSIGHAELVPKTICPHPSTEELSTMPPLFILGLTSLYLGGLLRLWCFRILGNLFTFEISIRANHKLLTHGPYSVVRHPSYLGIVLLYTGMIMVEASPNGYLTSCGVFSTYRMARWVFIGWVAVLEYIVYSLAVVRPGVEDENLRATFGKEWEEYRDRVPYKIIPGVF